MISSAQITPANIPSPRMNLRPRLGRLLSSAELLSSTAERALQLALQHLSPHSRGRIARTRGRTSFQQPPALPTFQPVGTMEKPKSRVDTFRETAALGGVWQPLNRFRLSSLSG